MYLNKSYQSIFINQSFLNLHTHIHTHIYIFSTAPEIGLSSGAQIVTSEVCEGDESADFWTAFETNHRRRYHSLINGMKIVKVKYINNSRNTPNNNKVRIKTITWFLDFVFDLLCK